MHTSNAYGIYFNVSPIVHATTDCLSYNYCVRITDQYDNVKQNNGYESGLLCEALELL